MSTSAGQTRPTYFFQWFSWEPQEIFHGLLRTPQESLTIIWLVCVTFWTFPHGKCCSFASFSSEYLWASHKFLKWMLERSSKEIFVSHQPGNLASKNHKDTTTSKPLPKKKVAVISSLADNSKKLSGVDETILTNESKKLFENEKRLCVWGYSGW